MQCSNLVEENWLFRNYECYKLQKWNQNENPIQRIQSLWSKKLNIINDIELLIKSSISFVQLSVFFRQSSTMTTITKCWQSCWQHKKYHIYHTTSIFATITITNTIAAKKLLNIINGWPNSCLLCNCIEYQCRPMNYIYQ